MVKTAAKYLKAVTVLFLSALIPLGAMDLPMIPKDTTTTLDFVNIQLYQQQKVMIFCCCLLLISFFINLVLLLFYWNNLIGNREINERVSQIRLTLSDLAQKSEILINAGLGGANGQTAAINIPIAPEDEEESIEIIKKGF